jgi:hypothetical protein
MKRFFVLALLVGGFACGLHAQAVNTTVCDIVKNPKSFDGKIVSIKGVVTAGLDQFIVRDPTGACGYPVDSIWLAYPAGTKGKAGAGVVVEVQPARNFTGTYTPPTRAAVTLDKSKEFKQFDSLMAEAPKRLSGLCLGCVRYTVTATLVGRLDGVQSASLQRDKAGKIIGFGGFGNLNAYPARLVLQSVADVQEKEVDYSKTGVPTRGDFGAPQASQQEMFDPIFAAGKSVEKLKGSPAGEPVAKDVAQFAKGNGATIINGPTNEASPKDEALGTKDSPDGILFNCLVNQNRVDLTAELRAIIHMGQHISDLRAPAPGNEDAPLYILEYNAWSMTIAVAAYNSPQTKVTMPGGYLLWDAAWPVADRNDIMDKAIKEFLSKEAALSQ